MKRTTRLLLPMAFLLLSSTQSSAEIRDREIAQQELELLKPCVDAEKYRMEQLSGKNADPRDLERARVRHQELLSRQEYLTANMPSRESTRRSDGSSENGDRRSRRSRRRSEYSDSARRQDQANRQYQQNMQAYRQNMENYRRAQYQRQIQQAQNRNYYRQQPTYQRPRIDKQQLKRDVINALRSRFHF